MRRLRHVRVWLVAAAFALSAAAAGPALASSIAVGAPADFSAGVVPIVVTTDSGITSVTLDVGRAGQATETVELAETAPGVFGYDLPLNSDARVVARGFVGATETWTGSLQLARASFAPRRPAISVPPRGALLTPGAPLTCACDARTTTMTVQVKVGKRWYTRWSGGVVRDSTGHAALHGVSLPYGGSWVRVFAVNAFGAQESWCWYAYNLGTVPDFEKMVLVDKSDLRIWVIRSRVVTFTSRCAVGMPWTPTPTGTFRLGTRERTPNAVWGPWRLRLYRRVSVGSAFAYKATAYYIHGTNDPSSIGHYASHGCVRLPNPTIRALSTVINGNMAVIRE